MPYLRPSGRGSPAPSRPAASASSSTGRASHLASTPVSHAASPTATTIKPAITTTAAVPRPAPITSAGTPTISTPTPATAKADNHSFLRISQPATFTARSFAAFKAEPDAADRGDVPGAVRVVTELAAQPGNVHVERLGGRPPF